MPNKVPLLDKITFVQLLDCLPIRFYMRVLTKPHGSIKL